MPRAYVQTFRQFNSTDIGGNTINYQTFSPTPQPGYSPFWFARTSKAEIINGLNYAFSADVMNQLFVAGIGGPDFVAAILFTGCCNFEVDISKVKPWADHDVVD